ncbi:MAG: hypothetical protein AMS21_08160, partial [Gemmatimonas sp. SG8_38_2]
MTRILVPVVIVLVAAPRVAAPQEKSDDRVIAEAVSALPEPMRDGAAVMAFRDGELVMLREGSNAMICLGDDPAQDGWHVACYHRDLEPFMARGRELIAQGVSERPEIDRVRMAEIESGKLGFPDGPTTLYSWFGEEGAFNAETGEAEGVPGLYVIYV